ESRIRRIIHMSVVVMVVDPAHQALSQPIDELLRHLFKTTPHRTSKSNVQNDDTPLKSGCLGQFPRCTKSKRWHWLNLGSIVAHRQSAKIVEPAPEDPQRLLLPRARDRVRGRGTRGTIRSAQASPGRNRFRRLGTKVQGQGSG